MNLDHFTPTGVADPDLLELELSDSSKAGPGAGDSHGSPVAWAAVSSTGSPRPHVPRALSTRLPGSNGEHLLQNTLGTKRRAKRFYDEQVLDHLNSRMKEFIARMEMAFIATSDVRGECDASLRAGSPGFIEVLDDHHLAYPEYRGNGVLASLGNISENPHIGMLLVDFVADLIGLHINGKARVVEEADLSGLHPKQRSEERGRTPEHWVVVQVEEAYIHCRKHIPRMAPVRRDRRWGTDDSLCKGGDYFAVKGTPRPWHRSDEQLASRVR